MALPFTLIALVIASLLSSVSPDDQGEALLAPRSSLRASPQQLSDWNLSQVDPCTWSQVICDEQKHVTSLKLEGNGIRGEIPESIGNLSSLTSLSLEGNQLSGHIPSTLGNLKSIQLLTLSRNNLNMTIPDSLTGLSKLINILLDSKDLSGEIPQSLFNITKFNFTVNNLTCGGVFPHPCVTDSNPPSHGDNNGATDGILLLIILATLVVAVLCGGRDTPDELVSDIGLFCTKTVAMPQNNSEATRVIAARQKILEKELVNIRKDLLAVKI